MMREPRVGPVTGRSGIKLKGCYRCGGDVNYGDGYPSCLQCGMENYDLPINDDRPKRVWDWARMSIPYDGPDALLQGVTATLMPGKKGKEAYTLECPFCGLLLERGTTTRPSEGMTYKAFTCKQGHTTHVKPTKDGYTWS